MYLSQRREVYKTSDTILIQIRHKICRIRPTNEASELPIQLDMTASTRDVLFV